jgi:hypothetical protein
MNQINVVPYIDVMLVLLVIFMVTAPFVNPALVDLPTVGKSQQPPEAPMEVFVKADGSLLLRDRGKGAPGAFPALAGSAYVNGPADAVVKTLLEGRKGTAMASFKQLSDTELAAVIDYVRNSWGNANAEAVLPAQVKAAR